MEAMKKVEIVVDSVFLNRVLEVLEKAGVSGYTVIKDALGKGERGIMAGDELTDVFKNSYIFTVCTKEVADKIVQDVSPILKRAGGICILSDVLWLSH
ncbi:MAG: P-II family nitrogen regulator [Aquificaceae bacterium]